MKNFIHQYLFALFGLSIVSGPTLAESINLTLHNAVELAIQQNELFAVHRSSLKVASATLSQANGAYWPSLSASNSIVRTNSPLNVFAAKLLQKKITTDDFSPNSLNNPASYDNIQTSLDLKVPLYQGGAISSARNQAEYNLKASTMGLEAQQQKLIFNVIAAYTRIFQAQAQVAAAEKSYEAAQKHFKTTQALNKRGVVIKSDVMDTNVHRLNAEISLTQSKNGYYYAQDILRHLLNVAPSTKLILASPPSISSKKQNTESLIAWAEVNRPDLLALKQQRRASEEAIDMQRASFKPKLAMQLSRQWNSENEVFQNDNSSIMLNVNWNIFSGGSHLAAVNKAQANAVSMQHKVMDKQYVIRNEVINATRLLNEAIQRQYVKQQAQQQSKEALRIRTLRHAQGLEKTTDLLTSQAQLDISRAEAIRANFDVTLARATLLLTAGKLTQKELR